MKPQRHARPEDRDLGAERPVKRRIGNVADSRHEAKVRRDAEIEEQRKAMEAQDEKKKQERNRKARERYQRKKEEKVKAKQQYTAKEDKKLRKAAHAMASASSSDEDKTRKTKENEKEKTISGKVYFLDHRRLFANLHTDEDSKKSASSEQGKPASSDGKKHESPEHSKPTAPDINTEAPPNTGRPSSTDRRMEPSSKRKVSASGKGKKPATKSSAKPQGINKPFKKAIRSTQTWGKYGKKGCAEELRARGFAWFTDEYAHKLGLIGLVDFLHKDDRDPQPKICEQAQERKYLAVACEKLQEKLTDRRADPAAFRKDLEDYTQRRGFGGVDWIEFQMDGNDTRKKLARLCAALDWLDASRALDIEEEE
jgi:hypothetical protein